MSDKTDLERRVAALEAVVILLLKQRASANQQPLQELLRSTTDDDVRGGLPKLLKDIAHPEM